MLLQWSLFEARHGSHTGVVHPYVDAVKFVQSLLRQLLNVSRVAHVGLDCDGFHSRFATLLRNLFQQALTTRGNNDVISGLSETQRCPASKAAGRTSYDDYTISFSVSLHE